MRVTGVGGVTGVSDAIGGVAERVEVSKEVGMRSSWMRRLGLAAITSAVGWFAVGCAAERAPINQVQANAMSKSFFVGKDLSSSADDPEFYMRNTVIDVPYGASQDGLFTATYAQPLGRIKWEISEQYLIARQTYQHIENSDGKGSKSTNDGQVVAMFAVTSHFDIRRFHEEVLDSGSLPLPVLEAKIDRWIARGGGGPITAVR